MDLSILALEQGKTGEQTGEHASANIQRTGLFPAMLLKQAASACKYCASSYVFDSRAKCSTVDLSTPHLFDSAA